MSERRACIRDIFLHQVINILLMIKGLSIGWASKRPGLWVNPSLSSVVLLSLLVYRIKVAIKVIDIC